MLVEMKLPLQKVPNYANQNNIINRVTFHFPFYYIDEISVLSITYHKLIPQVKINFVIWILKKLI